MSKTEIKVDPHQAKEMLSIQINRGKSLIEVGRKIPPNTYPLTHEKVRRKDIFVSQYNQWREFTIDTLTQIFFSGSYSNDFDEKHSSRTEYVSASWTPDVDFYINSHLIPKIDYLSLLLNSLDQFQKISHPKSEQPQGKKSNAIAESQEIITLEWLWRHEPVKFWFFLVTALIAVFALGMTFGEVEWLKELISKLKLLGRF